MANTGSAHNFFGIQVVLAQSTAQNLLKLLQAVEPTVPATARELYIQLDGSTPGVLLLGDAKISASRYGIELVSATAIPAPSISFGTGSSVLDVPLASIYTFSTIAAAKVNVLGFC